MMELMTGSDFLKRGGISSTSARFKSNSLLFFLLSFCFQMSALPTGHWWRVPFHWCVFLPHILWLFIDGVQRKLPLTTHSLNTRVYPYCIATHELHQKLFVLHSKYYVWNRSYIVRHRRAVCEQHPQKHASAPVWCPHTKRTVLKTQKEKKRKKDK